MPTASRTELITTTEGYQADHDCAYADRLIRQETPLPAGT